MVKYATIALIAAGCLLVGCSERTAESIEADTQDTLESVLTPKIKAALIQNPILNEDGNLINVETDKGIVYLRGHVLTQEAKDEATQIAQRVLDESESEYTLMNELEIVPREELESTDDDSTEDEDDGADDEGTSY